LSARAIPILGEGVAEGGEGVPEGIAAGNVDLTHLDSDEGDCKDLQVRLDASGVQTTLPRDLKMRGSSSSRRAQGALCTLVLHLASPSAG